MTKLRISAGLGVVGMVVLVVASMAADGQEHGSSQHDPANLAGERVQPSLPGPEIPINEGAEGLWQSLLKLQTRASLMMIVAHPDDEDGGMLTFESRGQGVRAAMLTLTRGEGGQNLMSGDFDGALGLVRTQELLAADRYFGTDQMFGTEVDFGFSKTKEEAFEKWTHERVLYDAVRAVRLYRPLVITSVFEGGPTDGHGQHQVSGEMAQEVFNAAGDPKVFPEMGLAPWAPLKVYARTPFARVTPEGMFDYATNKYVPVRFYNYVTKTWTSAVPEADVVIHEGEPSKALGMSYVQFARQGLGLQRTQIGNNVRLAPAGAFDAGYHRYGSRVKTTDTEKSFFDGIDVSLEGIATLAPSDSGTLREALSKIAADVAAAVAAYSPNNPERCAPPLREGLKTVDGLITKVGESSLPAEQKTNVLHELRVKRVQFNDALVRALRLRVEARMESGKSGECSFSVTPGCSAHVVTKVINGGMETIEVTSDFVSATGISSHPERTWAPGTAKLGPGKTLDSFFEYGWRPRSLEVEGDSKTAKDDPTTRPYFTTKDDEQPYYDVSDPNLRLAPQTPPESFWVRALYNGVPLVMGQVVLAPKERAESIDVPVTVVPSLSVSIRPSGGVIPLSEKSFPVKVQIRNDEERGNRGGVRIKVPEGWKCDPQSAEFTFKAAGESQNFVFRVTPVNLGQKSYTLTAVAETTSGATSEGFRAVGYEGLTPTNMYAPSTYKARGVDVKVAPDLKVAYLPGTGDEVQASLENIGVHAKTVTVADVASGKLADFDAVILGVRAYAAFADLAAANGQLLAYAKAGGVVIVQYNTNQYDHDFGPYPLTLGGNGDRVVDEQAAVKILLPDNPLLQWPNRISEHDFDDWVEERGHGFMETWDAHYETLLETHDPGQDPQKGGLLVARTGKGYYIYLAYALYRQLPEGVPGAYRLFANLVSLGKNPHQ